MFNRKKSNQNSGVDNQQSLSTESAMDGKTEQAQPVVYKKKTKKKSHKLRTAILIAAGIIVLVVAASLIFGGKNAGTVVNTGTAEVMNLKTTVSIKGTVVGSDSADVYSAANYRITEILVEEGQYVKKGQVLAKLDASDLTDQYNSAKITYNDAKRAYNNAQVLYQEGAISKSEMEAAKSAADTAYLALSAFDIAEKGNVTSPIDGTVTRVNCKVGRIAGDTNNNGPIFVVENIENLKMEVKVSEYDIASIKVGQSVEISAEVLGKEKVQGVVTKISPTGESNADGSGMVIPVTIDIDKGDTNLIAGVTAKAVIETDSRENVLTVPFDSIYEDPIEGGAYVFIVNDDNTIKRTPVTVGLEGDFNVEITDGAVKEGAVVVLTPDAMLEDGQTVVPM